MKRIYLLILLLVSVTIVNAQSTYQSTHRGTEIDSLLDRIKNDISIANAWLGAVIDTGKTAAKVTSVNGLKGAVTISTADTVQTRTFTAGENLAYGNVCYFKSDGKMYKAKADASATTVGLLAVAMGTINSNSSGTFLLSGKINSSSLTAAATLYLSPSTGGAATGTAPTTAGQFLRVVGYAISTTAYIFQPDGTYLELQ